MKFKVIGGINTVGSHAPKPNNIDLSNAGAKGSARYSNNMLSPHHASGNPTPRPELTFATSPHYSERVVTMMNENIEQIKTHKTERTEK